MSDGFTTLNDHGGPLVGSRSHARFACEDGGSTAVAVVLDHAELGGVRGDTALLIAARSPPTPMALVCDGSLTRRRR